MGDEGRTTYLIMVRRDPSRGWSEVKQQVGRSIESEYSDATITGVEDDNKFFQVTVPTVAQEYILKLPQVAHIGSVQ